MKTVVMIDIDHVISDAFWRDPMIGDWDAYYNAGKDDLPVKVIVGLVKALSEAGYLMVGLTARPEKWRALSLDWMIRHGVMLDDLLMRPNDNHDPSPIVKTEIALAAFPKEEIAFVMDDRDDVCSAFFAEGISVLHVRVHGERKS